MLLKTERPHSTDLTMEEKLSSRMMMSAASLATSVPAQGRGGNRGRTERSWAALGMMQASLHGGEDGDQKISHILNHRPCPTCEAHRQPNIRLLERRRVIGAVARHCHHLALLLEQLHQVQLVLRGGARQDLQGIGGGRGGALEATCQEGGARQDQQG